MNRDIAAATHIGGVAGYQLCYKGIHPFRRPILEKEIIDLLRRKLEET